MSTRWSQVYCQTKKTCGGSGRLKGAVLARGKKGPCFLMYWRGGSVGKALATQWEHPALGLQKPQEPE